jgi:hypothetical protein
MTPPPPAFAPATAACTRSVPEPGQPAGSYGFAPQTGPVPGPPRVASEMPRRLPPSNGQNPPLRRTRCWSPPRHRARLCQRHLPSNSSNPARSSRGWATSRSSSGDIMPTIDQMLAPVLEKMSPEEIRSQQAQIDEQKQKLLQQSLGNSIETKLLYLDFLRSLPDEKRKEILPTITKRAEEQFYEKQLPDALKRAKLESAIEVGPELRKFGSSLAAQRRMFVERISGPIGVGAEDRLRTGSHAPGDAGLLPRTSGRLRTARAGAMGKTDRPFRPVSEQGRGLGRAGANGQRSPARCPARSGRAPQFPGSRCPRRRIPRLDHLRQFGLRR